MTADRSNDPHEAIAALIEAEGGYLVDGGDAAAAPRGGGFGRHHQQMLVQQAEVGTGEVPTNGSRGKHSQTLVAPGGVTEWNCMRTAFVVSFLIGSPGSAKALTTNTRSHAPEPLRDRQKSTNATGTVLRQFAWLVAVSPRLGACRGACS